MDLPVIVHAEAVLWSRSTEAGFTSILDPQAQVTAQNLKKFYADPAKVKAAVTLLKAKGFSVYSVGKTSISIGARPEVYQQSFGVTLICNETGIDSFGRSITSIMVKNATTIGLIDTSKSGLFCDLLAGIVLSQPIRFQSDDSGTLPERKRDQLLPSDLWGQLGGEESDRTIYRGARTKQDNTMEQVEIILIDSGCYLEHKYFANCRGSIKVEIPEKDKFIELLNESIHEKEKLSEDSIEKGGDKDEFDDLLSDLTDVSSKQKIEKYEKDILYYTDYTDINKDNNGHGTAMVASALAVAPLAKITMLKITGGNNLAAFDWIDENRGNDSRLIISCSWGIGIGEDYREKFYKNRLEVELLKANRITLFATGNRVKKIHEDTGKEENVDIPDVEALAEGAIAVGGAYRKDGQLMASDMAMAHIQVEPSKRVPNICGWCGPFGEDRLFFPTQPGSESDSYGHVKPGWCLINGGTSSATAQLAGVCALISQVWPGSTRDDVLASLANSATAVTKGKFAGDIDPMQIPEHPIGMVNITATIKCAINANANEEFRNYNKKQYDNTVKALANALKR